MSGDACSQEANLPMAPAVGEVVASFAADRGQLMDILLAVQHRFGHVSDDAVAAIATGLGLHRVEVEETVSFYAFFDRAPRGRNRIRLSKTPISFIKGAEAVASAFEQMLGVAMGGTSSDGLFTLEWTADIGMADQEPAALINGIAVTELKSADVPGIVIALRNAAALPKASVRQSLVKAGAMLGGPLVRGHGLKAAMAVTPDAVIAEITKSKLRGRGGAGFPTGMKWRLTRKAAGEEHYILCNADEGEPGTFKDRMLLADFPDLVFDGMTIAGYALGSRQRRSRQWPH